MTIDFGAESRRLRGNGEALHGPRPGGTMPPLTPPSPLATYGCAAPAPVATQSIAGLSGNLTPAELAALVRRRSAGAHALDTPFQSFFHAWPLLGRRSALAVIRHHYMVQIGREPTLEECNRYLRAATTERMNSGELRFRVAHEAGLKAPAATLSRGQHLERVLGWLARRLGIHAVPFCFPPSALAFDGLVLDAMRIMAATVNQPDNDALPLGRA